MSQEFETKLLTDQELIDIVRRAPDEIDCADAYRHFLEDLGELVTCHFGGELIRIGSPEDDPEKRYRCDNCGRTCAGDEYKPLEECVDLFQRLTPGCPVPHGECLECGAFVYEEDHIDSAWVASISHNECIPPDGGVYSKYDPDLDWTVDDEPCCDEPYGCGRCTS